ncbi:autotransporter domain-containing protein [Bradyrhizobium manausense]|uniref:autotransporter domain-containing protein n=1 Tax=Bradyrhizobium manausense TaxID=989370 RepID=UPI001BADE2B0|nr:autotransporter domain-containing protein [Bradyrhizobium manausense]MBR1086413.1 autotransporter domain-containing protein [Bradyrhizobium manausense]
MTCSAYRHGQAAPVHVCASRRNAWLLGCSLAISIIAAADPAVSQTQVNQTFNSQGPAPRTGPVYAVQSADAAPNGTESGAVQIVLPDFALGANTYFAGTPNGGIWFTKDGGTSWKALTDNQASLSIGSLSLDPTDTSGKTIIAGIGLVDNGEYSQFNIAGRGGPTTGLLYTSDGGASWRALGGATLAGESVASALARGSVILAATFETQDALGPTAGYGLFRSVDGGATFSRITGKVGTGLPNAAVTSMVADPGDPMTIYAAVKTGANKAATAVYISHDTGATWTPIFTAANSAGIITAGGDQTTITLAAGPSGSLAIAISDLRHSPNTSFLAGVFLSGDQGGTWNRLTAAPNVVPSEGQTPVNLHLAIDPTNKNIVYLTGDAHTGCNNSPGTDLCTLQAWRLNYNTGSNTSTATSLTFEGTAPTFTNANTAHADSRSITFDQSGNLILSSDGGIYRLTNPQGSGTWRGMNGNLSAFESYVVAYDANSKRLGVASQDNGVSLQSAPGSMTFNAINLGDGTNIAINDRTLTGQSAIYSTIDYLGFVSRMIVNKQGQVLSPFPNSTGNPGGIPITCNGGQYCGDVVNANTTFGAQFVLNKVDPRLIAISGATDLYTTQDPLTGSNGISAAGIDLTLTDLGSPGTASVISYGTFNDTRAIAIGVGTGGAGAVWFSTTNAAGSLTQLGNYSGDTPTGIVFDTRIQSRIFVADASNLYYTRNATGAATFATLTSNLPQGFIRPTSVEFIANNGVNALLVGGMNTPLSCTSARNGCIVSSTQSPITAADSDTSGLLSNWRAFGQGLPNTLVYQMAYNPTVDVLAVSSIGRGAYALYDVTSYFPQASVLQFGLADNNSAPDASYLTDGTVGSRPLIKYGSGTLMIAGNASYTGGTTINGGVLVLGNGGASGSVLGNVTFCSNAGDPSCDASTSKTLAFNRSDVFIYGGNISGPGQVVQAGTGTTILSGTSNYSGPTIVDAGMLSVTGLITSNVTVNAGGALSGNGTVGSVNINAGGLLTPAHPGSALTVQGSLAFATAGAYLVEINAGVADRVNVNGPATLGGNVLVALLGSSFVKQSYLILNATGGITGTFAGVNNLPAGVVGTLTGDSNNVVLSLSLNYNASGNLNANQQNVGNALSQFFNTNGSIPVSYVGLSPAALSQIAGEAATGSQQTTFQAMSQFITTLLDPFIGGRETPPTPPPATAYTEDDKASAYAASRATRSERERAAYAAVFNKAPLRQAYDPHWSVWASGFGGSQTTDGNTAAGSNAATSRIFGMAAGADYLLSPRTIAGFALSGGGTSFSVANSGTGRSDLFQAGAYVRHTAGAAYVAGALAYGWQDVTTDRMAMADKLHAEFNANALSGRVEGGYRYATKWAGFTPYAAGQFTTFWLPAYTETPVVGASAFALAYGAQTATDVRTELGIRADRSFALATGLLTLRGRLAWAHDFNPDRNIAATFQALPGAAFVVNGAAQASESALTTASAEMTWRNGWSALATFEGEFSHVTASYAGKGALRYAW